MNSASRLKDSPMDFTYDSPDREDISAQASSWSTRMDEDKKRPRDAIDRTGVFAFGSKDTPTGSTGAFLFHQPLVPTIPGPDVEMMHDITPTKAPPSTATIKDDSLELDASQEPGSSRPVASSGALSRVLRSRVVSIGKGSTDAGQGRQRSNSHGRARRKGRAAAVSDDWEDDEPQERRRVGRRKAGDTTNIHYVFGGSNSVEEQKRSADLSWLDPEWCLGMAQVVFNSALLLGVLWLIYGVVRTLQRDVADKVREYELEFMAEIESCSHSYYLNKCGTDGAVPALASACASWQKCSAKDPAIVGRARVAAETVAEIVNGFVDVVSWKSMLFTLLSLVIVVGATNSTLTFFRLRSRKSHINEHPYDSRYTHPSYGYPALQPNHPHSAGHWHTSPPATPSTKRMCK